MKDKILNELQLLVAIVLSREEVVPRFCVVCPEGDWTVFVPLPDDIGERQRRMQLVYGFMAWKPATAFVMSSELIEPDAVISAAIDRENILSACRPIVRRPLTVGPVQCCRRNPLATKLWRCCRAGVLPLIHKRRRRWCAPSAMAASSRRDGAEAGERNTGRAHDSRRE